MVVEDDIVAILVLARNVCPDSKQDVSLAAHDMQNVFAGLITL